MNARSCLLLGGLLGASGVAAGALGAHVLESRWPAAQLHSYEVAVRHQIYHALALLLVGLFLELRPSRAARGAAWAFLVGTLLFSGCLYAWLFSQWAPLVHLVPVGGVTLIVAWLVLAVAGWSGLKR